MYNFYSCFVSTSKSGMRDITESAYIFGFCQRRLGDPMAHFYQKKALSLVPIIGTHQLRMHFTAEPWPLPLRLLGTDTGTLRFCSSRLLDHSKSPIQI